MKHIQILFSTPLGHKGIDYFKEIVRRFETYFFDYQVFWYEDSEPPEWLYEIGNVIIEKDKNYGYAMNHLKPETLEEYTHIFYWMDDIDIKGFSIENFMKLFLKHNLEIAMPSLNESSVPIAWPHTKQKKDVKVMKVNMCEPIALCFTADAWRKWYDMLLPECRCGWGYDLFAERLCNYKRMGVIHAESVGHMRLEHSTGSYGPEQERRLSKHYGINREPGIEYEVLE